MHYGQLITLHGTKAINYREVRTVMPRCVVHGKLGRNTMGLIDKFKRQAPEQPTTEYQCLTCHTTFESTVMEVDHVSCADCGSPNIRTA